MERSDDELGDAPTQAAADQPGSTQHADATPAADTSERPEATERGGAAPSQADVMDALANVIDPELGLDFVELGLIYAVEVADGHVHVTYTLTTPGCPIGPMVEEQIGEFVGEVEGVKSVDSEMTFTPAWSPERMSEDAKFALGY